MEIRSFLAFELPAGIREIVTRVAGEVRKWPLEVKWVRVENIHLTVVFMGNVKTEDLQSVKEAVQGVCLKSAPLQISLRGMGVFPHKRNPRVLWLGLDGDVERMSHFRDALQKKLRPLGVKEEKKRFKPHLTLGRFRRPNKLDLHLDEIIFKYKDLNSPTCRLSEFILFKSDLKPGGAVYTKMASWPLLGDM